MASYKALNKNHKRQEKRKDFKNKASAKIKDYEYGI